MQLIHTGVVPTGTAIAPGSLMDALQTAINAAQSNNNPIVASDAGAPTGTPL